MRGIRWIGCLVAACALWSLAPTVAARADVPSVATAYAERLAEDPVYLSDHIAGEDADEIHAALTEAAADVDQPTFVLAVPTGFERDLEGRALLAAVHERLGEDGVYVLLGDVGITAASFGVDVPELDAAERNASLAATAEGGLVPHADRLRLLVDQIHDPREVEPPEVDPDPPAASPLADADGPLAGIVGRHDPGTSTGRANIAFTSGVAAGGVLVLGVGWAMGRSRRGGRR